MTRRRTRRWFLTLALSAPMIPTVSRGQQGGRSARIGYLGVNRPADLPHLLDALRDGLRETGWIEGQNLHIEYRWAEGMPDRLPRLAAELVMRKVQLVVVPATQAIQAARAATSELPIVMVTSNDPVADGFVRSLARPGRNITGLTLEPGLQIFEKQVELVMQLIPRLSRIAVLANPANRAHAAMSDAARAAARSFAAQMHVVAARAPDALADAVTAAMHRRSDALVIHSDAMLFGQRRQIVELAAAHRLPVIYPWREAVEVGGLMSYGASLRENFRRAATFVDRILKGAKPAELPVEQPAKFELAINLKTARALGLTTPQSVLVRANHVVE